MLLLPQHNTSKTKVCGCAGLLHLAQLFVTLWTVACPASLPMRFSRQEYWSGLPFPPPEDLLNPGINLRLLHLLHWQADSLPLSHLGSPLFILQTGILDGICLDYFRNIITDTHEVPGVQSSPGTCPRCRGQWWTQS